MDDVLGDTKENDIILDNGLFDSRHNFLSFCQRNRFQFDSLRRAKYSSMMILYLVKNPTLLTVGTTCRVCSKNNVSQRYWKCENCPEFTVCSECYNERGANCHAHTLNEAYSPAQSPSGNQELQQNSAMVWNMNLVPRLLCFVSSRLFLNVNNTSFFCFLVFIILVSVLVIYIIYIWLLDSLLCNLLSCSCSNFWMLLNMHLCVTQSKLNHALTHIAVKLKSCSLMPVGAKFDFLGGANFVRRFGKDWLYTQRIAETQHVAYPVACVLLLHFHNLHSIFFSPNCAYVFISWYIFCWICRDLKKQVEWIATQSESRLRAAVLQSEDSR